MPLGHARCQPLAHRGDPRGTAHGPAACPTSPRRANAAAPHLAAPSQRLARRLEGPDAGQGPQVPGLVPLGRGMPKGSVPGTGWHRTRRVVGKVLLHHCFFLSDPLPQHQEITGEAQDEHHPRPHDQGEST